VAPGLPAIAAALQAAEQFAKVLKAYEVLRDDGARALYDSGALVEQSVEL
jgi:curved DNA-binding protein CbpA